ncbi:hypothetical protein H6P81_002115 [Aristolochia fimbriata]|uniref:Uncharacterized protein n=1 Tax=Aristolochia fimbriata TaxID=158543 RepID=A0AAV7FCZ4_ARIFI|nr:hypothetical protein H6P81_002115 [Aristolochia fimbriata]
MLGTRMNWVRVGLGDSSFYFKPSCFYTDSSLGRVMWRVGGAGSKLVPSYTVLTNPSQIQAKIHSGTSTIRPREGIKEREPFLAREQTASELQAKQAESIGGSSGDSSDRAIGVWGH